MNEGSGPCDGPFSVLLGAHAATLVAGAAVASVVGASKAAFARQPAPLVKGPRVWLTWIRRSSTDAYDQSKYAPKIQIVLKRCARNSELVRERLGAPKRFAYGPTPIEALDVFTTKAANAPVHVFVHGGAGVRGSRRTTTTRPRCSSMLVRISSCRTSSM